jgi:PAS domain S-box-containing protein
MTRQELVAFMIVGLLCASIGLAGQYRRRIRAVTEQHARKLREQARALNQAPIVFRDIEGRITEWSEGTERLVGWTGVEAVGRRIHDLLGTQFPAAVDEIQAELVQRANGAER